jgi:superkiller protein 3
VVPGPIERVRPLDGRGRTFLAYFPSTGTAAVVKALAGDAERRLGALWAGLGRHPSVVRAAGLSEGEEGRGIVFDYTAPDAYSRKAQVRSAFERRLRREPLAFPETLRLGVLACRGLEHVYAGGIPGHGNLKPSNLLLGLDGGLRVSEPGLPGTESPVYLAPERFDGAKADEPSDVYGLGVVLFQMAAGGKPPFDAPLPGAGTESAERYREALRHLHQQALVPRLDSQLAAVLERCLHKQPGGRLAGMAALRAELEDLLRRETGLLPALPGPEEQAGWERAQQALALLAIGRAEPALKAFDEALTVLPPSAAVRAVRSTALHVLGRHEEAVLGAEEALAIDPQHAPAWRQKGESLAALGRSEEAASALEQAALLAPRDAAPLVALAGLHSSLGQLPQALRAYDRAVAADPDHVDVWLERGKTLAAAGLHADAAGALLRFLDLCSTSHPGRARAEELLREVRRQGIPTPVPSAAPFREPSTAAPAGEPPAEPEPKDAPGWNAVGSLRLRDGRLEQALAAFDRAIALDPRDPSGWAHRANVLFRLSRREEGLAGHSRALACEPRLAASWLNKAAIERSLGRGEDAHRSLLELLSIAPAPDGRIVEQARALLGELEAEGRPPAPRGALGFLLQGVQAAEAGRLEEAAAEFEKALGLEVLMPTAWLFRGDALAGLGRAAEAAHAYEEGLVADPADARLLLGLARCRARLGDLDTAAAALARCLEIATGEARVAAERLRQAVDARRASLSSAPSAGAPAAAEEPAPPPPAVPEEAPVEESAQDWTHKGQAALNVGRLEEALSCFTRALELDPGEPASWIGQAECLSRLGRFEEAVGPFDEALKRAPDRREAWTGRGLALKRLGRHQEAVESFARALRLDASDTEALYQKAGSEEQLGRAEDAQRSYEEFLAAADADDARRDRAEVRLDALREKAQPPPPPASAPAPPAETDVLSRAAALLAQRNPADALALLDQSLAGGLDEAAIWSARGDCLRALGRKEEAAASFDQALKRAPRDPEAWIKKGEALDAAGVFAEAIACYDRAVELHPRHLRAWNSKGVGLTRLGRMEEALACFTRALELDPRFALARFNKGAAEDKLGRGDEAARSFQAFLSLAPPSLRPQIQHAQKRLQALKGARA